MVTHNPHSLSILIPALNEAGTIAQVLRTFPPEYAPSVVVVDGGSTDGTAEIARQLGFRVIQQEGTGLGNAIETGVRETTGEIIVTLDADGAHTWTHVTQLLAKLHEGYDFVVASRLTDAPDDVGTFSFRRRSTEPRGFVRDFGNRLFTACCRSLFGVGLHDVLNGCKAIRRQVFLAAGLERRGQEHDIELVLKAHRNGARLAEVPIEQAPRLAGVSKLTALGDGVAVLSVIANECVQRVAGRAAAFVRRAPRPSRRRRPAMPSRGL